MPALVHYTNTFSIAFTDSISEMCCGFYDVVIKTPISPESLDEMYSILRQELLLPFKNDPQQFAVIPTYERIKLFFGEDADVSLNPNLDYYGPEQIAQDMAEYQAELIFSAKDPYENTYKHVVVQGEPEGDTLQPLLELFQRARLVQI